jgi:hypothetical protein
MNSVAEKTPAPVKDTGELELGLFFYRCYDCLEVLSSEEQLASKTERPGGKKRYMTNAKCACSGRLELMGQAHPNFKKLETNERRAVCDGRCTSATGPDCYCCCKCRNHGRGHYTPFREDGSSVIRPVFSSSTYQAVITRRRAFHAIKEAVSKLLAQSKELNSPILATKDDFKNFEKAQHLMVFSQRIEELQTLHRDLSPDGEDFLLPVFIGPGELPSIYEAENDSEDTSHYWQASYQHIFMPILPSLSSQLKAKQKQINSLSTRNRLLQEMLATTSSEQSQETQPAESIQGQTLNRPVDIRITALEQALNQWF